MHKILVSCPPMIKQKESFNDRFSEFNLTPTYADIVQQFTESELLKIIQDFDGWIVGDDPCTRQVLEHGSKGKLKAIVKWGVGIDNVDFQACKDLGIPAINTPGMFGSEVADMAIGYLINLTRKIVQVHNGVKNGEWIKPIGTSLSGKNVGIVGFGDIGKNIAKRMEVIGLNVFVYDPYAQKIDSNYTHLVWPDNVQNLDVLILACALNEENKYLIRKQVIDNFKNDIYLVNVSRGKLINQLDLVKALSDGKFAGVALDVYEDEPITLTNQLHEFDRVIFGTHNGSNTSEAVHRTSLLAIEEMRRFLKS
jgi:D-3-phosphoglycerate dehydrogenase